MADLAIAIKIATEDASSGPIGKIKDSLGSLSVAVEAPTRAMGGLVAGLGSLGLAAGGVSAVVDAVKGAGSMFGVGALSEMEQMNARINAFTKDADQTAAILAQVRKEAALTPFALGEMGAATAALLPISKATGKGWLDLVKQAEILAASNPMEGLKGASFALKEAMTGDFTSIIERFNLSRSSINKWKDEGVSNFEIVQRAMAEMGMDADLVAKMGETLQGRWSTFLDTLQALQMIVGQPIFDAMKEGLVGLQGVLERNMETFQTWAHAASIGMEAIGGGIKGVLDALAPVGETIAQAFSLFTEGDFAGGFGTIGTAITGALGSAVEAVQAFAAQMFGAGANLVSELAGGIISGASDVLQGAVDTVASMIASFLIGNSPPPDGPLAAIREGGANTIAAWGEGALSAANGAVRPAVDKIAGGLDELKESGRGVDQAIRDIGRSISDLDSQTANLKHQVDDIKDSYKDQLDPLEDQLKTLTDIKDLEGERQKLALSLEEAQLRQAEIAAQGDPRRLAELKDLQQQLKARQDTVKLQREQDDLQESMGGSEKDRLKAELDANKSAEKSESARLKAKLDAKKLDDQEEALRERLKKAKPDDRRQIEAQLKELAARRRIEEAEAKEHERELEIRKQIEAVEEKERKEAAARKREDIDFRSGELEIQQEITGLADKDALARIKTRQDEIKAEKDRLALAEQQTKLEREQAALPIRQEIERIKAEQEATLKPLGEQVEALGRQKSELTEQRQHWQGIKQEISAATSQIREQEAATKAATKAAKEAAKNPPKPQSSEFDAPVEKAIDKAKESGAKLASNLRDGFVSWLTETPLLSAGTIAGALFGAGQGAALGASLGSIVPVFGTAIGGLLGAAIGAGIGGIGAATLLAPLQAKLDEIVGPVGTHFLATLKEVFDVDGIGGVVGLLVDRIGDAITTGVPLLAGKLVEWGGAFVDWVERVGPPLLDEMEDVGGRLIAWIGETTTRVTGELLDWATAFVAWVGPQIPDLLNELGRLGAELIEWVATQTGTILDNLGAWAAAFVDWVGPKIPPLLVELGKLGAALIEWLVVTAIPNTVTTLVKWANAFVDWVGPRIDPLLEALGGLLKKVGDWILFTALPAIGEKLVKWGGAFLDWVAKDVIPTLPEKLGAILTAVSNWVTDKRDAVIESVKAIGSGILQGIQDGISAALDGFWEWLQTNFVDKIPSFVKSLLNINSPSGVFMDIGRNIVDGLRIGMEQKLPSVDDLISSTLGRISGMSGAVDDWLRAAIAITGAPESWLPGLRRLTEWESSGNPRAVNPNDVNNIPNGPGEHAHGLVQVIPSTFAAYRDPGLPNDIFDPVANAVASIGRIRAAWGTPYDIPGIGSGDHGEFLGYAAGGIAWQPQLAYVAEREPELIMPLSRVRSGQAGGEPIDYDRLADALARGLGPMIARTRPVTLNGTPEDLYRKVRRHLDQNSREHDSLRRRS